MTTRTGLLAVALLSFVLLTCSCRRRTEPSGSSTSALSPEDSQVCRELERAVKRSVKSSRSCQQDADCTATFLGCPFGCLTVVRRDAVEPIRGMVDKYRSTCARCSYRCPDGRPVARCVDGLCDGSIGGALRPKARRKGFR